MSGYPHGLTASPHGDALLRPGKDYELRGNEIVETTGGVMSELREVLEKFVVDGGPVVGMINANDFAPIIEKGLDAVIDEILDQGVPNDVRAAWHGVFVAAMLEAS